MRRQSYLIIGALTLILVGCKNRDLTEGEEFKPREIHENIIFNFDEITVDGVDYLILEKDNNNPHEGFGFMAFRANKLMAKQDTLLALLRTIKDIQTKTYISVSRKSAEQVHKEVDELYQYYLDSESVELSQLKKNQFRGVTNSNKAEE